MTIVPRGALGPLPVFKRIGAPIKAATPKKFLIIFMLFNVNIQTVNVNLVETFPVSERLPLSRRPVGRRKGKGRNRMNFFGVDEKEAYKLQSTNRNLVLRFYANSQLHILHGGFYVKHVLPGDPWAKVKTPDVAARQRIYRKSRASLILAQG